MRRRRLERRRSAVVRVEPVWRSRIRWWLITSSRSPSSRRVLKRQTYMSHGEATFRAPTFERTHFQADAPARRSPAAGLLLAQRDGLHWGRLRPARREHARARPQRHVLDAVLHRARRARHRGARACSERGPRGGRRCRGGGGRVVVVALPVPRVPGGPLAERGPDAVPRAAAAAAAQRLG